MTPQQVKKTSFLRIFLSVLLIGVLFIQISIFYAKLNHSSFSVPSFFLSYINKRLQKNGLQFSADSIRFFFNGKISAKNFKVFFNDNSYQILQVNQANVKLNPFLLFIGSVAFSEINFKNATLLCPPAFSPSGLHQPLLQNIFFFIHSKNNRYEIKQAFATASDFTLSASGYIPFHSYRSTFKTPLSPIKLFTLCYNFYQQLSVLKFSRPFLHLAFSEDHHHAPLISTTFAADTFTFHPLQISTQQFFAHLNLILNNKTSSRLHFTSPLTLLIRQPFSQHPIFPFSADLSLASFNIPPIALAKPPTEFASIFNSPSIFLSNLKIKDSFSLPALLAHIESYNKQSLNGMFSFLNNDLQSIEAFYTLNLPPKFDNSHPLLSLGKNLIKTSTSQFPSLTKNHEKFPLKATVTARIHIDHNFLATLLPDWTILSRLHFDTIPYTILSATFLDQLSFDNATLSIFANSISYDAPTSQLTSAYAQCILSPQSISVPKLILTTPTSYLSGSYSQNLSSQDYRFLISGSIEPDLLTPWLPVWWKNLWAQFQLLPISPPKSNFDFKSNWLNKSNHLFYGYVSAKNFSYRTVPLEQCSLFIHSIPTFIKLFDINAIASEHETLTGFIEWDYNPLDTTQKIKTGIKATSKLSTESLIALTQNQTVFDVLSRFKCSSSPEITCEGAFYPTQSHADTFTAKFNTSSSLIYSNIPLDHLSFLAYYTPAKTTLNAINFGFAKGNGQANATITPQKDTPSSLSFNANLSKAELDPSIQFLKSLSQQPAPSSQDKQKGGFVDLSLSALGTLGNLSSFTGTGSCTISQSNLGNIYLFGILSRILDLTPFPFGTFQLTDATSNFKIQKDIIDFPSLRIYGQTALIQGNGRFSISSQDLDFSFELSPLGGINIPIVSHAFALLNPISKSFKIKLRGTLQDPNWNLNLGPPF